jgi:hypothetical protein
MSLDGLRSLCLCIGSLIVLGCATMTIFAQAASAVPAAPMPEDPKQLVLLAAQMNGLNGDGLHPWHLKASYTSYDANGNASDQGTIEISWASDRQWKFAYADATSSLTYYVTKKGTLRSGSDIPVPSPLSWIAREFVSPTLPPKVLRKLRIRRFNEDAGGIKLVCLTVKDPRGITMGGFQIPTYCVDSLSPTLRIGSHEGDPHRFLRNNAFIFQNRYVPKDIAAVIGRRTDLRVHLEDLELLNSIQQGDFEPPPDARPVNW